MGLLKQNSIDHLISVSFYLDCWTWWYFESLRITVSFEQKVSKLNILIIASLQCTVILVILGEVEKENLQYKLLTW